MASQVAAIALILGLAAVSWQSIATLLANQAWLEHTHEVIEQLSAIETSIADVQRSARGFAITGDEAMLVPYRAAVAELRARVEALRLETRDNPVHQQSVTRLAREIDPLLAHYDRLIETRRHDANAATELVRGGAGARQVAKLQAIVDRMQVAEDELLQERSQRTRASSEMTARLVLFGNIVAVIAVIAASFLNQREMKRRILAQRDALRAAAELEHRIAESEHRSAQVRILATLGEYLQVAQSESEAASVAARYFPELLPQTSGEIFAIVSSREAMERVGRWPEDGGEPDRLEPNDCWALRKGTVHQSEGNAMRCPHLRGSGSSVCLPMMANGEMVGLVTAEWPPEVQLPPHVLELARSAAEQVSLAYSSVALREALRRQAIRDPLTSLFNRRYAEESITREIARAARRQVQMSVILIDVDHFKQFNDALGHGMGDRLLREISSVISHSTRSEDVAARYGGDEFIVILSETKIEQARERAEEISRKVRRIGIVHPQTNRAPSLSIGIAAYPDHGNDGAAVIEAADVALYLAKERGRDRVESAQRPGVERSAHS